MRRTKANTKAMDEWMKSHMGWSFNSSGRSIVPKNVDHDSIERRKQGSFPLTIKRFDPEEKMEIFGVANENTTDRMDEILDPVGVKVENFIRNPILLLQHNHNDPVGQVPVVKIEDSGVHFEAWVGDPKAGPLTTEQIKSRTLIAQGILKAGSVGFIPLKIRMPAFNDNGDLVDPAVIESWEWLEHSLVSVPCNAGSLFEQKGSRSKKIDLALPKMGADGRFIIPGQFDRKGIRFPTVGDDGKFKIYGT